MVSFLMFSWLSHLGLAQQQDTVVFERLTSNDGLSHNNVRAIIQNRKGYIWFGSYGGNDRYDGQTFKNFKFEHEKPYSLSNNHVTALLEDHEYMVWAATSGNAAYLHDPIDSEGSTGNRFGTPFVDRSAIWKRTHASGVNIYGKYTYKLKHSHRHQIVSGGRNYADDTKLAPGIHTVRMRGANSDGVWNHKGEASTFVIQPPWWNTWWTYLGYFLLWLAGVFLANRETLRRERLRTEMLIQQLEADKLRIANKLEGLQSRADEHLTKPFDIEEPKSWIYQQSVNRETPREQFSRPSNVEPKEPEGKLSDRKFLQKIFSIVEEHLDDPAFDVKSFSKEIGMSRVHLYRKLKMITGQSPGEFVRTFRLKKAAMLLEQQRGNVSEVAYAVGFSSLSYFSKSFRAQYGLTPSEYIASSQIKI